MRLCLGGKRGGKRMEGCGKRVLQRLYFDLFACERILYLAIHAAKRHP